MRPIVRIDSGHSRILLFFLFLLVQPLALAAPTFRTPARLYAGAYSIKIQLKRNLIDYDIPVWIKPDQPVSSLDPTILKDLGYNDPSLKFDELRISGIRVTLPRFIKQKSEWAYVPDFSKSCCYGVIGQDLLSNFQIRFDPHAPAHLEWTQNEDAKASPVFDSAFLKKLKSLFSLKEVSDLAFNLNLNEQKLTFEGSPHPKEVQVFEFWFIPPDRNLRIASISKKYLNSARQIGFKTGETIIKINDQPVSKLDRWQIEEILSGRHEKNLRFTTLQNKHYGFDFNRGGFLKNP